MNKQLGAGYGTLPPRHASLVPWNQVDVDLIGPWRVQVNGEEVEFNALTCIDPVTSLVELIRINRKTAGHIAQQFENVWLARYPRPNRCAHDNGGEFIGWEFQEMLQRTGVQDVHTTSRNPQGNSVCERLHQTVGDVLRTYLHADGNPHNMEDANQLIDNASGNGNTRNKMLSIESNGKHTRRGGVSSGHVCGPTGDCGFVSHAR